MTIHLVKLCVGADSIEDLANWQAKLLRSLPQPVHRTRMRPKRAEALLAGGSLYWVIKRQIRVRQRLIDIKDITGRDGRSLCELVLDPELVRTELQPRKPFQGWRYLEVQDAPADLAEGSSIADIPEDLGEKLRAALVW